MRARAFWRSYIDTTEHRWGIDRRLLRAIPHKMRPSVYVAVYGTVMHGLTESRLLCLLMHAYQIGVFNRDMDYSGNKMFSLQNEKTDRIYFIPIGLMPLT